MRLKQSDKSGVVYGNHIYNVRPRQASHLSKYQSKEKTIMRRMSALLITFFTLGIATGVIGMYWTGSRQESPYLSKPGRLNDVIGALTMLGNWRYDKLKPEEWQDVIGFPPMSAEGSWSKLFDEHPEFFRKDHEGKVSLVWRRALDLSIDTTTGKEVPWVERANPKIWPKDEQDKLVRRPLEKEEIAILVEVANNMQTQAIARRAELRWWVAPVLALGGVIAGAFLKHEVSKPNKANPADKKTGAAD